MSIDRLDVAILRRLRADALRPRAVAAIIDNVITALDPVPRARDLAKARKTIETLDREIARLTEAIVTGGSLPSLLTAPKARQDQRSVLAATVGAQTATPTRLTR